MTRTISIVLASALLAACSPKPQPMVTVAGSCEALRPALPIQYHGGPYGNGGTGYDTPTTVKQVKNINARFAAACG